MEFKNPNKEAHKQIEKLLDVLAQKGVISENDARKVKADYKSK